MLKFILGKLQYDYLLFTPKSIAQKTKPIVVKIISNLVKTISNII